LTDIAAAMASKLTPFLMRTAARAASRAARPLVPQTRAFSLSARKQSDSLMVVSVGVLPVIEERKECAERR
jgi:hypothetical protein